MAWVPQWSSSAIVATTVLDEVMATARAVGMVEAEAEPRARGCSTLLGIAHLLQADPRHLSGGEQRRLARRQRSCTSPRCCWPTRRPSGTTASPGPPSWEFVEGLRDAGSAVVLTTTTQ